MKGASWRGKTTCARVGSSQESSGTLRGTCKMVLVKYVPSKQSTCIATVYRQDLYLNSLQHLWLPWPSSKEAESIARSLARGCELIPVSMDVGSRGSPAVGNVLMPLQTSSIGAGGSFREEWAVLLDKLYLKQRSLENVKLCFKQFCIAVRKRCSCTAGVSVHVTYIYIGIYICIQTQRMRLPKNHRQGCIWTHVHSPRTVPLYICVYLVGFIQGKVPFAFCFLTFQGEKCPAVASGK